MRLASEVTSRTLTHEVLKDMNVSHSVLFQVLVQMTVQILIEVYFEHSV